MSFAINVCVHDTLADPGHPPAYLSSCPPPATRPSTCGPTLARLELLLPSRPMFLDMYFVMYAYSCGALPATPRHLTHSELLGSYAAATNTTLCKCTTHACARRRALHNDRTAVRKDRPPVLNLSGNPCRQTEQHQPNKLDTVDTPGSMAPPGTHKNPKTPQPGPATGVRVTLIAGNAVLLPDKPP